MAGISFTGNVKINLAPVVVHRHSKAHGVEISTGFGILWRATGEKRRVVQLHKAGLSVSKIAKTMGRGRKTVDLCLVKAGLREAPPYLARK